jgi:hypothetical protein
MPYPLRGVPVTVKARGLSDTIDSTNLGQGLMSALTNLIPAPNTLDLWVPRPASMLLTSFGGFTTPNMGEAVFGQGNRIYGFIQTARFAGHSEPFIWDQNASAFVAITGVTSANTPTSTSNTGDWTPPTISPNGAFIVFTHPGFNFSGGYAFGWLDMTGFTSTTITGSTHSNTTVDTFSTPVLAAGWRPGMTISDSAGDIPANTTILSISAAGVVTLSAAATGSNAATTFTVGGGTFAAPLWAAGNIVDHPLLAVPTAALQYAGSTCYAVNTTSPPSAAIVFSDAGDPLRRTDSGKVQITTFQNALPITVLAGLPFTNLTGGIVQSLIAFQGDSAIQQLTGTPILSDLQQNVLSPSIGTLAPNSLATSSTRGLYFSAPDGVRLINQAGVVTPPLGRLGSGVTTPFMFAQNPTRQAAAYNESVYRISVQNGAKVGVPTEEYWYHEDDDRWTGPHTFPASVITPTAVPHGFGFFAAGIAAKLWSGSCYASLSATFVENGVQMTFLWQTSRMPDTAEMQENAMVQTAIAIAVPALQNIQVTFYNDTSQVLDQPQLVGPANAPAVWGSFVWGAANWGAGLTMYYQQRINWTRVLIFKQGTMSLSGNCAAGLVIGNVYMRYQPQNYLLQHAG